MAQAGQPSCASALEGSSATNGVIAAVSIQQRYVNDSAFSAPGGRGLCVGSLPASTSPFAWDADGAQDQALISPVQSSGKKKGRLLSGLKKMFQHPKSEGRAATGEGDARPESEGPVSANDYVGFLESSSTKSERRVKVPPGLKVQVSSSRDHNLAAILTSPVRAAAAPSSPAMPNSPMPSMRLEHAASSKLSSQDGDASCGSGSSEQRLLPNFTKSSPCGKAAQNHYHPPASGSGSFGKHHSGPLLRGVSGDIVNGEYQRPLQASHGGSSRVALPYLISPRNQEQPQRPSASMMQQGSCPALSPGILKESYASGPIEVEVEDEELDPGLLGMNPAVPLGMRRRKWCLEDYQVIKRMYKGATSAVYRAICLRSGTTVALKVYFLTRVPINVVHMIQREVELHLPLVHRNIVMLYGAFQDDKHIILVEEFAARGDLFGIHRSMNCRLSETQTSELILTPFLDALAYLHARGVMHRDIKPENILFTQDWVLKVADFGVSINVYDERAVTRTGTADYMAPEVERCPLKHNPEDNKNNPNLAYTTAIDIWSVGVLVYEMLVGFPPFVSNGSTEEAARPGVAAFLAEQATRKTLRFPASVSASAKDFIMATLNENPEDRPTARELLKHPWVFRMARRVSISSTSRFSNPNLVLGPH